jgi:hypothetical protein
VGRASNRKRARRQAPQGSRQTGPASRAKAVPGQISSRNGSSPLWPGRPGNPAPGLFGDGRRALLGDEPSDVATQHAMLQLAVGLKTMTDQWSEHKERVAAARRAWCGGAEPVPAEVPLWPKDSVGDRFLSGFHLKEAQNAPTLLTADVPDAALIRADSAHWNIAANALVRAVAFDGLRVDHPAVSALLDVLAPVAEAELAYGEVIESPLHRGWTEADRDGPSFPEDDGPVLLIGAFALVDATLALVGTDPLGAILPVLRSAAEEALPGVDGGAVADALVGALARHYVYDQPGDADILEHIGRDVPGNALEQLVTGVVPFGEILRVGLSLLSALTELCMNGSASILDGSPERGPA